MSDLEIYYVYREYIKHQDHLVNERLTRLFLAHGSLIAVPGLILSQPNHVLAPHLRWIVAGFSVMGVTMCGIQFVAILAGLEATKALRHKWDMEISS